jgi:hypothetical protein
VKTQALLWPHYGKKPGLLPQIAAGWWSFHGQKKDFSLLKAGISFVKKMFIIYNRLPGIWKGRRAIGRPTTVNGICLHSRWDTLSCGVIQKL